MAISLKERERRFSSIRKLMKADGLDCLLVAGRDGYMSRGNIRYITNYGVATGEQYCIFHPEGNPIYLTGKGPIMARLQKSPWKLDFRVTSDTIAQALKELSILDKGNKIGIVGMQEISVPMYSAVKDKFGNRLVDSTGIFRQMRIIKSAEEIEAIRKSAAIADKIYIHLTKIIRPGLTGHKIYSEIKKTNYAMGCEYSFELISSQGTNINLFHPTGDKLVKNGLLTIEITPAYEGYFAQLPVTMPVGEYPPHILKIVDIWKRALKAAVDTMRPGTKVSDVYHAVLKPINEGGYRAPWRPGHAVGLDLIDFWSISSTNMTVLEPGMVLAVHPNVLCDPEIEGTGVGMGYTYLITETGCERFSKVEIVE